MVRLKKSFTCSFACSFLDGSGYVEDGRDIFDDDLDSQSIAQASNTKAKGVKRKKNVSEISNKGNIQLLLSNLPNKKREVRQF